MKAELAPLPCIVDVKPLSLEDEACMAEIKGVLMKHHRLQRFVRYLAHEHFKVAEDEILLETCNLEKHTLMIRPAKNVDLQNVKRIVTNWRLTPHGDGGMYPVLHLRQRQSHWLVGSLICGKIGNRGGSDVEKRNGRKEPRVHEQWQRAFARKHE